MSEADETDNTRDRKDVYFIGCQDKKRVKIGVSQAPRDRLAEFQTSTSDQLYLIETVHDAGELVEETLHTTVKPEHIRGEWFSIADDIARDLATWATENLSGLHNDIHVDPPPGWGTIQDIANEWDISERTVYRWRQQGDIIEAKFGDNRFYRHIDRIVLASTGMDYATLQRDIEAFMDNKKQERVMRDITFREDQLKDLKAYCIYNDYTVSEVIEYALERILPENMSRVINDS